MALEIPIIDQEQYLGGVLWYRMDLTDIVNTLGNTVASVVCSVSSGASISILASNFDGINLNVEVGAIAVGISMLKILITLNDGQIQPVYQRTTVIDPN